MSINPEAIVNALQIISVKEDFVGDWSFPGLSERIYTVANNPETGLQSFALWFLAELARHDVPQHITLERLTQQLHLEMQALELRRKRREIPSPI